MRSHDRHSDVAFKSRKRKSPSSSSSSSEKFNDPLERLYWPGVVATRGGNKPRDVQPDDGGDERRSPPGFSEATANNANVLTYDLDELLCENDDAGQAAIREPTTCTQITSSTEPEEGASKKCFKCEDCTECQLQDNAVKMRETGDLTVETEEERFDYENNVTITMPDTVTLVDFEVPILVDLTSEDSKAGTWKQTILKRFDEESNRSSEVSEPRIMIADSSSRMQRSGTSGGGGGGGGGSLATALRDRGPCVIPVQPNRSLPIRPAPPMPTRSAASVVTSRKLHSPILKLSKPVSLVEVRSEKVQNDAITKELSDFLTFGKRDEKSEGMILTNELIDQTEYILPDMPDIVQITEEASSAKRKSSEDRDREYEKEMAKDAKKRGKSHEVDASRVCDEAVEKILKEYTRYSDLLIDKGVKRPQQVMLELWNDKRCSPSVAVSTTETEAGRTKEACNKVVPPLRLKKVVREASIADDYRRNVEVSTGSGNELNYRIVTGATPRPESPAGFPASYWNSTRAEKDFDKPCLQEKSRRASSKSDGFKIKFRRNRLREKLRELRCKALELSHEMTLRGGSSDTNAGSQHSTRLRQMMNRYEKQIENVSKLLCKLSASIPSASTADVIDLDYENELIEECIVEGNNVDIVSVDQLVNEVSAVKLPVSISLSPSPEPPQLSPSSPIDYEKSKSPDKVRNSPPVLPRVYIAIQPVALERIKPNLATKSWHRSGDNSSGSSIEKGVKVLDNSDQTIVRGGVTYAPITSPISSSGFESPRNGTVEWSTEEPSAKLLPFEEPLKTSGAEEKIQDTKTFDNVDKTRPSPLPISDDILASMNIEIDVGDTKEPIDVQGCLDEVITQAKEAQAANNGMMAQEEQGEKRGQSGPGEESPASSSILEEAKKSTEAYKSEERVNNEMIANASTVAQETPTIIERPQVTAASNVTNILQLQSNYYTNSAARDKVIFTGAIQNTRNAQQFQPKQHAQVTASVSQSVASNPTIPLVLAQPGPTVSSSNQQCIVTPNSCNNKIARENAAQRNDGKHIMTEQFPTLGNWLKRMSKKHNTKSKSKSGVTLPTASTAEVARLPGLETQKVRTSVPSNATRNNVVNVAPQWNTERWQKQQYQQRQQQLYATASSAAPAGRPGICPPISASQFYPHNYAIDPYGNGAAYGYQSICPYGDCSYHSRLNTTVPPPISSYQIPLQDPHSTSLRQMQHLDKRFPAHLHEAATRHFATDLLKYPAALSTAGNYQHTAASLEYERLEQRLRTAATQNGTTASAAVNCLPSLLMQPPPQPPPPQPQPQPSLPVTTQQTLARAAPQANYSSSTNQVRNRMIPDVVAAAAAAAVMAAASFGRQRGPLPPYGRTDAEMVSGGIGGIIDNESTQLIANRTVSRERLPEQVQNVAGTVGMNSRLNNGNYHQLQNFILDRLPYVKTDDTYSQPVIYGDNAHEASTVSSSSYKTNVMSGSSTLILKEAARKEGRNCDTPHLGKVNRTLDTTNSLECSNCGLRGSMFKCLGCEAVYYCDERCQTRHWNIHVEKCPKRMPRLKKLI